MVAGKRLTRRPSATTAAAIAATLGLAALVVGSAVAVRHARRARLERVFRAAVDWRPDLRKMQECTPLRFPPSRRLLYVCGETWLEDWFAAKVELDPADVPRLLASLPAGARKSRKDRLGVTNKLSTMESSPAWWDPDSARSFVAVNAELPLGGYDVLNRLQLLVNLDDPRQAVVYLFWDAD